jgi:hypothetical protein
MSNCYKIAMSDSLLASANTPKFRRESMPHDDVHARLSMLRLVGARQFKALGNRPKQVPTRIEEINQSIGEWQV